MLQHRFLALFASLAVLGPLGSACCFADPAVIVSAIATPEYTQRKFGGAKATPETYVVMQGHYFDGGIVDRSIERMPFRQIAEIFAPELAKRQFWPAKEAKNADLLIVVHWGTTVPQISTIEMQARTSPLPNLSAARDNQQMRAATAAGYDQNGNYDPKRADIGGMMAADHMNEDDRLLQFENLELLNSQVTNDYLSANSAQLLGYTETLRKYGKHVVSSAEEYSLRLDLSQMRYFIILRAYDLHASTPAARSRAVWTLHLNVSSPGNSFDMAVNRMSAVAASFAGSSTDEVKTVRQPLREGRVEIGPLVILGEVK